MMAAYSKNTTDPVGVFNLFLNPSTSVSPITVEVVISVKWKAWISAAKLFLQHNCLM